MVLPEAIHAGEAEVIAVKSGGDHAVVELVIESGQLFRSRVLLPNPLAKTGLQLLAFLLRQQGFFSIGTRLAIQIRILNRRHLVVEYLLNESEATDALRSPDARGLCG